MTTLKTLDEQKDPRTKAADIESVIKHHIRINAEDDPEYYKDLSKDLRRLLKKIKTNGVTVHCFLTSVKKSSPHERTKQKNLR